MRNRIKEVLITIKVAFVIFVVLALAIMLLPFGLLAISLVIGWAWSKLPGSYNHNNKQKGN